MIVVAVDIPEHLVAGGLDILNALAVEHPFESSYKSELQSDPSNSLRQMNRQACSRGGI